jgi:hypothetical protein
MSEEVVSHGGFNLYLPNDPWDPVSPHLLINHSFILKKYVITIFALFITDLYFVLLIELQGFFIYFEGVPYLLCFTNVFCLSVEFSSIFLIVSFEAWLFLRCLVILSFIAHFGIIFKNILPNSSREDFSFCQITCHVFF